jgi:hypothetical protein
VRLLGDGVIQEAEQRRRVAGRDDLAPFAVAEALFGRAQHRGEMSPDSSMK